MNRFQRLASNHKYYGYLTHYTPQTLRTYQSERFYSLGRKGAYDTLVYKMGADHINYEEEMNTQYKTPTVVVNTWMRVGWFLFLVPGFMIMMNQDDMTRVFIPHRWTYMGRPTETNIPTRYETLYAIESIPKY